MSTAPEDWAASSSAEAIGGKSVGQRWYSGFAQLKMAAVSFASSTSRAESLASAAVRVMSGRAGPAPRREAIVTWWPWEARRVATELPINPAPTTR